MKVIVFGAKGGVGKEVVTLALQASSRTGVCAGVCSSSSAGSGKLYSWPSRRGGTTTTLLALLFGQDPAIHAN